MIEIDIQGLDKLERKLAHLPDKLNKNTRDAMEASLIILSQNVPEAPPKPPHSKYVRTDYMINSLLAQKEIPNYAVYNIKGTGANIVGTFGTQVEYARYVIDENRQAYMHKGRWWTMKTIVENTKEKIINLWNLMIKKAIS
jgi:hypothetical protein